MSDKQEAQRRRRRSPEERLRDLEEKQRLVEAKLRDQLARIEKAKRTLQESPRARKEREAEQRVLMDRISRLVPDWEPKQVLAAVARVRQESESRPDLMGELAFQGGELMQSLRPRRGRRPRAAA